MCKEERDAQIAALYLSGVSAPDLARKFALSESSIRLIVKEKGVKAGPRTKTERGTRRALSNVHERLGEQLVLCRSIEMKHTRKEAAERLGWTVHKVAAIEAGTYDVTLTDLVDLASYTKKTMTELAER